MHITIAICTWNRGELLRQTLQRLTEIEVPPDTRRQVLIVNNNCSDDTNEVAAAFRPALDLRIVLESRPGLSHARNRAIDEAAGEYIAWIDDDVLVDRRWLSALAAAARRHPDASVFGGPIEPWFPAAPDPELLSAFPDLAHGFCGIDHGGEERYLDPRRLIYGANMAFKRSVIDGQRFDPALGIVGESALAGEELEFIAELRRRGGTVVWVPDMRVKHYVDPSRMTVRYLSRFTYHRARTMVRRKGPPEGRQSLGAPRWLWRAMAWHYLRYTVLRLTPLRREALASLREYQHWRGTLAETLAQRRRDLPTPHGSEPHEKGAV